jgi:hypothetical protein
MLPKTFSQKGQALILIVLAIIGLVAITALAIDAGNSFSDRRHAQSAADTAALAAALKKANNQSITDIRNAAFTIARSNLYNNDSIPDTVTVNNPPAASCNGTIPNPVDPTDPTDRADYYIQVIIYSTVNTYFGPIIGINQTHNCVEAIARGGPRNFGTLFGGNGIVALTLTDIAYNLPSGSPHITVHESNLFSNSSRQPSVVMAGNPRIYLDPGYSIAVVAASGGTQMCSWCYDTPPGALPPVTSGAPQYSQAAIDQTLATIPARTSPPTCPDAHTGVINTTAKTVTHGNYPTGLSISGSGTYTFESGVYCINGTGGFQVGSIAQVNSSSTTSDVVLVMDNNNVAMNGGTVFYFRSLEIYTINGNWTIAGGADLYTNHLRFISSGTGNNTAASDTTILSLAGADVPDAFFYFTGGAPIWAAGASLKLHAPPSGDPFAGLLVYMPWSNQTPVTFAGGTNYKLTGTILAPHSTITITAGNTADLIHSQFIGYKFIFSGGANVVLSYSGSENYGPSSSTVELTK